MKNQIERIEHKYEQIKPIEKPIYKFQSPDAIKLRTNVDTDIDELKKKFKSISQGKITINTIEINKMTHKNQYYPKLRNYYPRPTPADVSLEERTQLVRNNRLSKQATLDLMCSMTMAATAYKAKRATDREAAVMITQGFTGQLKGWRDNFLTLPEKN
ncbi:hypothetical protein HN873_056578 [Arachis hypogaea]